MSPSTAGAWRAGIGRGPISSTSDLRSLPLFILLTGVKKAVDMEGNVATYCSYGYVSRTQVWFPVCDRTIGLCRQSILIITPNHKARRRHAVTDVTVRIADTTRENPAWLTHAHPGGVGP